MDRSIQTFLISQQMDFSIVSFNAWDIRVHLPREAHDKNILLPSYLQHPKTFDLRTEYNKWSAHHPEVPHHHPVTLGSICLTLEVDPAFPIKGNATRHHAHRAMEEAVTVTRALQALICKSQPIEFHPDVLAHPVDTKADIKAFLAERSKILYMSNLPHDTTQSELESWFTQYGGRPIAFWTMRTPDQHKPTGTGFALFSSHEEAIESLAMNGRALNERAIEVSPSGAMVLDRASEILASFPPSKNRPRPGDWTCPSCGFSNFQRRTACFRCSYPAAATGAIPSKNNNGYGYGNVYGYPVNTLNSKKSNGNLNGSMGYVNQNGQAFKHNGIKYNSGGSRVSSNNFTINNNGINLSRSNTVPANFNKGSKFPSNESGDLVGTENNDGNDDNNDNNSQSGINSNNSAEKSGRLGEDVETNHNRSNTGSVPFRAGDWKCRTEGCNYHNFAKNICCLKCGASRVAASMDGGPDMLGALPGHENEYTRGYGLPRRAMSTSSYNNNGFKPMQRRNVSMAAIEQLPTIPAGPEAIFQHQQQQQQQLYRPEYGYAEGTGQPAMLRRKSTRSHSLHHHQPLKHRASYQQFPQGFQPPQQHQQQQQQHQQQQHQNQPDYGMAGLMGSFGSFTVEDKES